MTVFSRTKVNYWIIPRVIISAQHTLTLWILNWELEAQCNTTNTAFNLAQYSHISISVLLFILNEATLSWKLEQILYIHAHGLLNAMKQPCLF